MYRPINLRQIEAFKAVIQNGTISRGASVLNISQPAMSKLIAHLEADTGLRLFDRMKGRLAPTEHAMRLYQEIDRIFAGVREVERAVEVIRREGQGRLAVGVMTALAGSFIQRVTTGFLEKHPDVLCSVQSLSSEWVVERLIARQLDLGLVSGRIDNPNVALEPLLEHPLVCIMPRDHPLAAKRRIRPQDLDQVPFVAYHPDTYFGSLVRKMFDDYKIGARVVLLANVAPTICEFVAAGHGVSLVHPLTVSGLERRLIVRRFEPTLLFRFQLCRRADSRNSQLVEAFAQQVKATAGEISRSVLTSGRPVRMARRISP
jgi:DNA-binding transcriptional LysR family regulator